MAARQPLRPNILVTGTPGVGKTSLCAALADATPLRNIELGSVIREQHLHQGQDEEFDALVPDEDAIVDSLDDDMVEGGVILDYHGSDFFPERWFSLVIILRCRTDTLFDRLTARGYSEKKREENMECEIMGVCAEEATSSYPQADVWQLPSDTVEDQDVVVSRVVDWCRQNGYEIEG
eukprot:Hpha_TRINITY_DN2549_c0_g1::TRINITY_DN2549_c0_g1_i1::g.1398::m.1398/K18532/AK6, FAP7; adenylate kinase